MAHSTTSTPGEGAFLFDGWFDPIEAGLRTRVRGFIETLLEEELTAALSRPRYGRPADDTAGAAPGSRVAGHRHGHRTRQLTGSFGPTTIAVPRARLTEPDGTTREWKSAALRSYQRCTVHKHRNLLAHAPEKLCDEVTADYRDMIYAETAAEIMSRRKAFLRKWRLRHRPVAASLEEAGDRLFTFTRLPPGQWKSARTSNATKRLYEEFKATQQDPDGAAFVRHRRHAVLRGRSQRLRHAKHDGVATGGFDGLRPNHDAQGRRVDLARHSDR